LERLMSEPVFDERLFMPHEQAEADDTIDLHEHDDPGPRYKRIVQRLLERATEQREQESEQGRIA
jgi:hypothetical protein